MHVLAISEMRQQYNLSFFHLSLDRLPRVFTAFRGRSFIDGYHSTSDTSFTVVISVVIGPLFTFDSLILFTPFSFTLISLSFVLLSFSFPFPLSLYLYPFPLDVFSSIAKTIMNFPAIICSFYREIFPPKIAPFILSLSHPFLSLSFFLKMKCPLNFFCFIFIISTD